MDYTKLAQGKSITTSVPSIAIRFHAGDEQLDVESFYASADEEGDGDKEGDASSTAASTATNSPAATPSIPSRDPSPMKEYLKGLGKRSTSVDGGISEVGTSDTWRIFHELRGKITKTVEEKFTEMKNERKGTPVMARHKNRPNGASISDTDEVPESSEKNPPEDNVSASLDVAISTSPVHERIIPVAKPSFKDGLRRRKSRRKKDESSGSDNVESGVEVLENTTFSLAASSKADDYEENVEETIAEVDYSAEPPAEVDQPFIQVRRNTLLECERESENVIVRAIRKLWSYKYMMLLLGVSFVYLKFSPPPYVSGMIMGIFLTLIYHLTVGLVGWHAKDEPAHTPFIIPDYSQMPILEVPVQSEEMLLSATKCVGWMNELPDETYDPEDYHINNTQSVYVRLEGSLLRLSHPKSKVQKRAFFTERPPKMKFVHHRTYDIYGCKVELLPKGLTRKRTWSKKYPICITLTSDKNRIIPSIIVDNEMGEKKASLIIDQEEVELTTVKFCNLSRTPSESEIHQGGPDNISAIDIIETLMPTLDDSKSVSALSLELAPLFPDKTSSTPSLLSETSSKKENDTDERGSIMLPEEDDSVTDELLFKQNLQTNVVEIEDESFCMINESEVSDAHLFLFARADRQKEDWYRRLVLASKYKNPSEQPIVNEPELTLPVANVKVANKAPAKVKEKADQETEATESLRYTDNSFANVAFIGDSARKMASDKYLDYMSRFYHKLPRNPLQSTIAEALDLDREVDCDVMWLNAVLGHIIYDLINREETIEKLRIRLQKKLEAIKLPYFMETLLISKIEVDSHSPMIHRASRPVMDDHGLWVDLDVSYEGNTKVTLETKLNLMKLKKSNAGVLEDESVPAKPPPASTAKSPIYHSDIEDSAETTETSQSSEAQISSSDEAPSKSKESSPAKKVLNKSKGVIRIMNKIVESHLFQQATEIGYIKRAMEGVSNTVITLVVEIRGLTGQLAINLPPPPSDRLWYGFRGNPKIWLKVRPQFGNRRLNIKHVVSWIERKLIQEFQKKFIIPNMDDLVIPPMTTKLPGQ